MTKKEALKIVLEDLLERIPATNKDGFLASDEVYEAIELLSGDKK
tara:strand:+ start:762 stop:896 length:135 start_codon:yes stop_codon:yes gene_type:complete